MVEGKRTAPVTRKEHTVDKLVTPSKAARILGVSTRTLTQWANAGKVECIRVGTQRHRRYYVSSLVAFMNDYPWSPVNSVNPEDW